MVFQHWAEAAGTADLASPLTARPGTVKSFPTTFDSLDDLWQLEKKLLEPPQESVSEEADARSQATANETLPRIEGDTFSLEEEPARGQAVNMVRSCLQSSLALKQALQDESIDPYEMKGILRNLGRASGRLLTGATALYWPGGTLLLPWPITWRCPAEDQRHEALGGGVQRLRYGS
ncbi:Protein NLRC3 [Durusdinium trenchii]|uniref:Protein NLRC3 n=1 Tax=Durusdinium trenchii TaxID=1381693 RepID=A0ABP0QQZ8_9DINO